jgi:hypothetical protein
LAGDASIGVEWRYDGAKQVVTVLKVAALE